jgi:hypothetical protein
MSQPTEDFPEIRRVLAWKGRETPPPGYFNQFSTKIIARIEAEQLSTPAPWWRQLAHVLNWQRGLLGANLLIAAGAGIVGIAAYHTLRSAPEEDGVAWSPLPQPITGIGQAGGEVAENQPSLGGTAAASSGPLTLAGFSSFSNSAGNTNDHTVPVGLFNPPGIGQLQPRFVMPAR